MTKEYEDWSLKVQSWHSHVSANTKETYDGDRYVYHTGYVATPFGFVIVASDASHLPYTALSFIWRGREYNRSYKRYFRPRHIITLAKQFASEISAKEPSQ